MESEMSIARSVYMDAWQRMSIRDSLDLLMDLKAEGIKKLTQIEADPKLEEMFVDRMCELAVGRADGIKITGQNRYVKIA